MTVSAQKISREKLVEKIKASAGSIITVEFIKRTNGKPRSLNGRLGVAKYVKGTGRPIPASSRLITIYDMQVAKDQPETAYRCIPEEGVYAARINGVSYEAT